MANVQIFDLPLNAAPPETAEMEIQLAGEGESQKSTVVSLWQSGAPAANDGQFMRYDGASWAGSQTVEDSDGKVGIGIAPAYQVDVATNVANVARFQRTGASAASKLMTANSSWTEAIAPFGANLWNHTWTSGASSEHTISYGGAQLYRLSGSGAEFTVPAFGVKAPLAYLYLQSTDLGNAAQGEVRIVDSAGDNLAQIGLFSQVNSDLYYRTRIASTRHRWAIGGTTDTMWFGASGLSIATAGGIDDASAILGGLSGLAVKGSTPTMGLQVTDDTQTTRFYHVNTAGTAVGAMFYDITTETYFWKTGGIDSANDRLKLSVLGAEFLVPISTTLGLTVGGDLTVQGEFTSRGIDDNAVSTALTLDSSGNALVGGTAAIAVPANPMVQVLGADSGSSNGFLFDGTAWNVAGYYGYKAGAEVFSFDRFESGKLTRIKCGNTDAITFGQVGGTEYARFDNDGNLGVKNATPGDYYVQAKDLVVGSGSGNRGISIVAGTTSSSSIAFADGTGVGAQTPGLIRYSHGSNFMIFFSNDSQAFALSAASDTIFGASGLMPRDGGASHGYDKSLNSMDSGNVGTGSTTQYRFWNNVGVTPAQVGTITTSGSGTQFNQTSDPRIKTPFETADPVIVMSMIQDFVTQKAIGKYKFLADVESMGAAAPDRLGFNAHLAYDLSGGQMGAPGEGPRDAEIGSVYEVDPETGAEKTVTPWGVDQSLAVPHLVIAADYHENRIAALESRVTALESP